MEDVVIVSAARTAVGKFGGSIAKVPAQELGATVIRALLARSGVSPELINEVILDDSVQSFAFIGDETKPSVSSVADVQGADVVLAGAGFFKLA